ncbi:MAG TPA: hypothetical protein VLA75_09670, partial [Thermoanaerobaculia bacterium]|nr:hypothetical protein [Thermoanaerobaculia bacterium]
MRTLLDADRASILLIGEDGRVHFVAWRGLSERYRAAVDGHSPWGPNDADAQPVVIPDVEASDLEPKLKAPMLEEGLRALAF